MNTQEKERLEACLTEIGEILYNNTPSEEIETLEGIETTVRKQTLEYISPKIALFFSKNRLRTSQGRKRKIKSCLGDLNITTTQSNRLGLSSYQRYSPLLEKCCLLVVANESYQKAEEDIKTLTGIEVGHSSLHRKAQNHNLSVPDMKQKLSEISVDGGSVRLRGEKGEKSYWQQYKTARLQGIYYGAFFQDNLSLTDWINSQKLTSPVYCLGDGHDGIWKIFEDIGEPENRQEILDWYHLKENLYKIEGSKKRIKELEALLWQGKVEDSLQLLRNKKIKRAKQFCEYLEKHRHRIINYQYFQAEQICSIGSGAVESGVKQIDQRLQKTGAQWKRENVNCMLQLRCAYLNGLLSLKLA